jgi:hypothetical protein
MQEILIKSRTLIQTLNWFSDWVFSQDQPTLNGLVRTADVDAGEACSLEYLHKRQELPNVDSGYPMHSIGFDLNHGGRSRMPDGWYEIGAELDSRMVTALGVGFNALKMYYPENGYIGWHNNSNCAGQNLIMTYTPPDSQGGYFQFQNPITKEIVTMHDSEGWTAKAGYFGSYREPDKVIWHTARCYNKPRLTISYVIRDQWMWEEMVHDIQSDQ